MENKGKLESRTVVMWMMNIIIILLSIGLMLTAGVMIGEFISANTSNYNEDSFYYSIQQERFFDTVGYYHHNTKAGLEGNAKMQEFYGVAKYYEYASLYQAYTVYGNLEQAEAFRKKMQDAESDMGDWDMTIEPIQKQLGMEE